MTASAAVRESRGKYFEDFEPGAAFVSPRRTVTQTDIVNFACLSGDFNPPHVDHEYCREQPYGEPIAHGPLIFAIAAGLLCQMGLNDGTIIAMLGVDKWRVHSPVKHGDTIHVVQTVMEKKPTSKPHQGVVTFLREVKNQRGDTVQSMECTSMYKRRPA